ncbi:MAG TPA: trigger factor family protein [Phaeodactylibacter sp.]|nr:trigger factor family protein [Phaeodactylibacter sp.]
MAQIERKDISPVEWEVKLTIEPEDYRAPYEEELKKLKGKVHIKGFRKGRVPLSFLKKTYGGQILPGIIEKEIEKQFKALEKESGRVFVSLPLPLNEEKVEIDPRDTDKSYDFYFVLALLPEVDFNEEVFKDFDKPYYTVIPGEEKVGKFWNFFVEQVAEKRIDDLPEREVVQGDEDLFLYFTVKALEREADEEQEEEGEEQPEDFGEFTLVLAPKKLPAESPVKEKLAGLKKGDECTLPLNEIYEGLYEMAGKDPDDFTIEEWSRYRAKEYTVVFDRAKYIDEATFELKQEDYDAHFGEDHVHNKEEALEAIRDFLKTRRVDDSRQLLMWEFSLYLNELWKDKLIPPATHMKRRKEVYKLAKEHNEKVERWFILQHLLLEYFQPEVPREMVDGFLLSYMGLETLPVDVQRQLLEIIYKEKSDKYRDQINLAHDRAQNIALSNALYKKLEPEEKELPEEEFDALMKKVKEDIRQAFDIFRAEEEEEE